MKYLAALSVPALLALLLWLPDNPAYHHEDIPSLDDRIAVLLRQCAPDGAIDTRQPICAAFADEIRQSADAVQAKTTLARVNP